MPCSVVAISAFGRNANRNRTDGSFQVGQKRRLKTAVPGVSIASVPVNRPGKDRPINFLLISLIIAAGIVAFVFMIVVHEQQRRRLNATYRAVALRYSGTLTTDDREGRPCVRFAYHGVPVLLDSYCTGGENEVYYTQLHIGWPEPQLRMEVFPERFMGTVGKLLGSPDINIGSPAFDRVYIIRGNDPQRITALLTTPVQASIDKLRRFLGDSDIYIGAKAGTLLIKKKSLISSIYKLESFVALGLAFYDEIAGLRLQGIEILDQRESSFTLDMPDAVCQICGEPITSDAVLCRSCRTPHHRDCWAYCGKCSTYGCGETRFVDLSAEEAT